MSTPLVFEVEESEKAKAFEAEHQHKGQYKGAIGGHISYTFCPTSIGTVTTVKCSACDASLYVGGDL